MSDLTTRIIAALEKSKEEHPEGEVVLIARCGSILLTVTQEELIALAQYAVVGETVAEDLNTLIAEVKKLRGALSGGKLVG